jgi:protein-L-isoaspartate(D-aspartate) O-methyltransferase
MDFELARFNMIEQQIRPWEVLDPEVLSLLATVKREDFVPSAYRNLAFVDMEIPLGDVAAGELMLAPKVEARLLQELRLRKHERVLEIGSGSGHMAALLAHRAAYVTTLEKSARLAKFADANLYKALVVNVKVEQADGSVYRPKDPLDAIVLSGSVHEVPQTLLEALKVGGRLIGIVGDEPIMRAQLLTRLGEREWRTQTLFDTVAPRLSGFAEAPSFAF